MQSCTHMATVGVKRLNYCIFSASTPTVSDLETHQILIYSYHHWLSYADSTPKTNILVPVQLQTKCLAMSRIYE